MSNIKPYVPNNIPTYQTLYELEVKKVAKLKEELAIAVSKQVPQAYSGEKDKTDYLSDYQVASKVRMLGRNDLTFEFTVTMARDRIMSLSKEVEDLKQEHVPYYGRPVFDETIWKDEGDPNCSDCGHPYHRHFDGYEDWAPVGCKYCGCGEWKR